MWSCGKDHCFFFPSVQRIPSTLVGGRREINNEGAVKWGGQGRASWPWPVEGAMHPLALDGKGTNVVAGWRVGR